MKEIKHMNKKEEDLLITNYNYKNIKDNLKELKLKIIKNDLISKTERIYLNNNLYRITPLLKSMREKEVNINRIEKFVSSGVSNYK